MTDLVDKQDVKAALGITSVEQDINIDNLIPTCSDYIKEYCRNTFIDYYTLPKTELFHDGGLYFTLSEVPLQAVTSVEESLDYGQTWTHLVLYTDYAVDWARSTIHSLYSEGFASGINRYRVVYTAGYENTPDAIQSACISMIDYYLKNNDATHSGSLSALAPNASVTYVQSSKLPASIVRILDLYRTNLA